MRKNRRYAFAKPLLAFPYLLFYNSLQLALPPSGVTAEASLWNVFFGRLAGASLSVCVVALQGLGFLLLFLLLFGDAIAAYWIRPHSYAFVRVTSRLKWFAQCTKKLAGIALLFSAALLGADMVLALHVSGETFSVQLAFFAFSIWLVLSLLLMLVFFCNTIFSLLCSASALGMVCSTLLLIIFAAVPLAVPRSPWLLWIDPLCLPEFGEEHFFALLGEKLCALLQTAALWWGCGRLVQKKDVLPIKQAQ